MKKIDIINICNTVIALINNNAEDYRIKDEIKILSSNYPFLTPYTKLEFFSWADKNNLIENMKFIKRDVIKS